jgi:hypothetical protein
MRPEETTFESLAEARELLQSLVLLSAVAGFRASRLRGLLRWLMACGFTLEDLAVRLHVPAETLEEILSDDRSLSERLGISDESLARLLDEQP